MTVQDLIEHLKMLPNPEDIEVASVNDDGLVGTTIRIDVIYTDPSHTLVCGILIVAEDTVLPKYMQKILATKEPD